MGAFFSFSGTSDAVHGGGRAGELRAERLAVRAARSDHLRHGQEDRPSKVICCFGSMFCRVGYTPSILIFFSSIFPSYYWLIRSSAPLAPNISYGVRRRFMICAREDVRLVCTAVLADVLSLVSSGQARAVYIVNNFVKSSRVGALTPFQMFRPFSAKH